MGWIPDLPDARDYTFRHEAVVTLLRRKLKRTRRKKLPDAVDLRYGDDGECYFSEPDDQGPLNSSSACAVISLVEYFERRIRGRTFEASKLFLYKATRDRLQSRMRVSGDTGADLRTTIKELVQFGVPSEELWPYHVENFDREPSACAYREAQAFSGLVYFRLDEANSDGATTWETLKSFLAAGFPVVFGFSVPTSLTVGAEIPYRFDLDSIRGGQVVVAVGYENHYFGRGQHGILIRNSWGRQWGDNGNGWLPVSFLRKQLAKDLWTMTRDEWLDDIEISQPSVVESTGNVAKTS